jgi:hypothetical protein
VSNPFEDCAQLSAAADDLLARSEELKALRTVNPGEARNIAARIAEFEKRFRAFLSVTNEVPKLREDAKAALANFASARERFNLQPGGQVEVLEKKFTKFLADTEEIPAQRDVAEEALLKFAAARSLLSGEAGN